MMIIDWRYEMNYSGQKGNYKKKQTSRLDVMV